MHPGRKGPKVPLKLPASAFSPPNTGTGEKFPLAPSPSALRPKEIVDARVPVGADLSLDAWKEKAAGELNDCLQGAVLFATDASAASSVAPSSTVPILSLSVPFDLEASEHTLPSSSLPLSLHTAYNKVSPQAQESLRWAMQQGRPVEIDIQAVFTDSMWENFEEALGKATADIEKAPPIILSHLLPPAHDIELPVVKLMSHPSYRDFQAQVAALSLFASASVNFLPPNWDGPSPFADDDEDKAKTEWKRKIKMYLGPVLEAFGDERIMFGSGTSPSPAIWYDIARESLAELAVDQQAIDAVFSSNAKRVYGS
ncbi:hypothetical protein BD626DRAFT_393102 [Schizophyllum amplum]|uniref:Amidohydrolase-related domain-containing protein n=1 Tax=Schizophyllum amplum TaxID=97359 RepID=A0A550CX14_9AGAR|nr:hypothetical protein BD626DRAFT_393102 [Auriculariopsis ampla]